MVFNGSASRPDTSLVFTLYSDACLRTCTKIIVVMGFQSFGSSQGSLLQKNLFFLTTWKFWFIFFVPIIFLKCLEGIPLKKGLLHPSDIGTHCSKPPFFLQKFNFWKKIAKSWIWFWQKILNLKWQKIKEFRIFVPWNLVKIGVFQYFISSILG